MTAKKWLSLEEQIRLLRDRGLVIADEDHCRQVLKRVGYYHLSGYWRFFQVDPRNGDNTYRDGTTFATIAELHELDSRLRRLCLDQLMDIELALRMGFAYRFGELVSPYGALQNQQTFSSTGTQRPVHEEILGDLDRAKHQFVSRHRTSQGTYDALPVWIAVEALAFGTLSKAIEHCKTKEVVTTLADDFRVAHRGFSSQVRSFVALRNACAHLARLWNDVCKNPPLIPNNIVGRAKRSAGQFHPHSYYHVFVALDRFTGEINSSNDFLTRIDKLLECNATYRTGILNPSPYI